MKYRFPLAAMVSYYVLTLYLAFSFSNATLNITQWDIRERQVCAILIGIGSLVIPIARFVHQDTKS